MHTSSAFYRVLKQLTLQGALMHIERARQITFTNRQRRHFIRLLQAQLK